MYWYCVNAEVTTTLQLEAGDREGSHCFSTSKRKLTFSAAEVGYKWQKQQVSFTALLVWSVVADSQPRATALLLKSVIITVDLLFNFNMLLKQFQEKRQLLA